MYLVRKAEGEAIGDCRKSDSSPFKTTLPTRLIATLPAPVDRDADLAIADIDGDGKRDVVLVQGVGDAREFVALFNLGESKFTPPVVLANASSFGFARVVTTGTPSLVAATKQGNAFVLVRVDVKAGAIGGDVPLGPGQDRGVTLVPLQVGRSLKDVSAIGGGDVDGDGVDDLVVVDGAEARVLVGKPKQ